MTQIEKGANSRFITALTSGQVDWSPFPERFFPQSDPRKLENVFPSQGDFFDEVTLAFIKGSLKRYSIPLRKHSEKLETFLEEHRPPTLFFAPQDIANALTPESDIIVNRKSHEGRLGLWVFSLNPKKHEADSPSLKQTITLTTIEEPERYHVQEPYLVVGFPARYDGSSVTFYPSIKQAWGDNIPKDELDKAMTKFLGLKEHTVEQQLDFRVIKEEMPKNRATHGSRILMNPNPGTFTAYPVEISLK